MKQIKRLFIVPHIEEGMENICDPNGITEYWSFAKLREVAKSKRFYRYIGQWHKVTIRVTDYLDFPRRTLYLCVGRLLASRKLYVIETSSGSCSSINCISLIKHVFCFLRDGMLRKRLLENTKQKIIGLGNQKRVDKLRAEGSSLYIRSDRCHLKAGGSAGHIAGVCNALDDITGGSTILCSSAEIPNIDANVDVRQISYQRQFLDYIELPEIEYNQTQFEYIKKNINGARIRFIYQRYALNSYVAVELSKVYQVPLVTEFNGSFVWMSRYWGSPLIYESESDRIEMLNLQHAALVVVVSDPMRDQLIERGIDSNRILVNPNGVDPQQYHPDINSGHLKDKLNLHGKQVIGFIGTFGPWHGATHLVQAYLTLLKNNPKYINKTALLLIGDGDQMGEIREIVRQHQYGDHCVLTGMIAQAKGPEYLSCCDILVNATVPNPDGTPFFGSPTKLFEYMAMGRGIVCSDMAQMKDILTDRENALMYEPGNVEDMAKQIQKLLDSPRYSRELGSNARALAISKYTWHAHTQRIYDKLMEITER